MALNRQGWNACVRHLRSDQFLGGEATAAGMYIAKMRLATNTYAGKDESGNRKQYSEFHNLVAFGKLAEFAGQYMKKGRPIYAEGRLHTSSWDDAAGQKRYRTEVVVE